MFCVCTFLVILKGILIYTVSAQIIYILFRNPLISRNNHSGVVILTTSKKAFSTNTFILGIFIFDILSNLISIC